MIDKKRKSIYIVLVFSIIIGIAISIDGLYKIGDKVLRNPNTHFSAGELLAYFGSVVSLIGTSFLAYITYKINLKATDVSYRMVKIEEERHIPMVDIIYLTEAETKKRDEQDKYEKVSFIILEEMNRRCSENKCSFDLINTKSTYIYNIELITFSISIINEDNEEEINEIYSSNNGKIYFNKSIYLRPNETKVIKFINNLTEVNFADLLRYKFILKLEANGNKFEEEITFDVINIEELKWNSQKNKKISVEKQKNTDI